MSLFDQIRALLAKAHARAKRNGWKHGKARIEKAQAAIGKPQPKPAPKVTTWPAIAAAKAQSATGQPFLGAGMCLAMVRLCYGAPAGVPDAIASWTMAKVKHRETNPLNIPRGYPVYWSGGSAKHGHIAISAGGGMCWSTDIKRTGFFDRAPIQQIHDQWGLTLLGWTEDINGVPAVAKVVK